MKQFLLATALIAVPVAAFSGFQIYEARAAATAGSSAPSLGDLSSFATIITDVQDIAAKGDLAGAKTRIKDFEIAWDQAEAGLKPLDPTHWGLIDQTADGALTALRATTPDTTTVTAALAALQATLADQKAVSQ